MALIELAGIGQAYNGKPILQGIDLSIERGEVFALIGPTGAGKTTLIRILDLLDPPSAGRVVFDRVDVTHSGRLRLEARRRMSYVQQKPIVFSMNVHSNVACGLKWRHEKKDAIRQKVESALDLVGMAEYSARDARTLSGGETQRVAIARALVTDPELLILDEPTANLDPPSVSRIEDVLERIIAEHKIAVLMATHDVPQGQRLAGRMGVLMNGRMLQVGTPNEVFVSPNSREVAEFVGVGNMLAGVVISRDDDLITIDVDGTMVEAISDRAVGNMVYALIRPEDVTLRLSQERSSARNILEGPIARMAPLGTLVRIEIDCGFPLLVLLTRRSVEELDLSVGSHVFASFKATAIHIIDRHH